VPGRHRKPTHRRTGTVLAATGALVAVPLVDQGAAYADTLSIDLGPIVACESGGNPRAQNPSSTASGTYQMLDSTWAAYGGRAFAARAKDATPAQQTEVAERLYAARGLSPWAASRHCWAGKVQASRPAAPKPTQTPATNNSRTGYRVQPGDTLARIAAAEHLSWQELWAANRAAVTHPETIYPGQVLTIPASTPPAAAPAPAQPAARPASTVQGGGGEQLHIQLTGYSYQDNTPPGSATVSHPVLHKVAGGTGTYADPITVAVPNSGKGQYPAGTRFYLPSVHRYVIVEDTGASPAAEYGQVDAHLDMWIGGQDGTRAATDACMDRITGKVPAELNPPSGRPVTAGPVYAGGCHI
jgi:LysM repeat protein